MRLVSLILCPTPFSILALEKLGAVFNQVSMPLQYTPRKFVIHAETNNLIIIETDHNAYTEDTKQQRKQQMAEVRVCVNCLIIVAPWLLISQGATFIKEPVYRWTGSTRSDQGLPEIEYNS